MRRLFATLLVIGVSWGCHNEVQDLKELDVVHQFNHYDGIEHLLGQLTLNEKLGQLFIYQTDDLSDKNRDKMLHWIETGRVSGFLLDQLPLTSYLDIKQESEQFARLPLFWVTNQPILLNNQFKGNIPLPNPSTLEASQELTNIDWQQLFVKQLDALGINLVYPTKAEKWNETLICNLDEKKISFLHQNQLQFGLDSTYIYKEKKQIPSFDDTSLEELFLKYPEVKTLFVEATDIVLTSKNIASITRELSKLIDKGIIPEDLIDGKVRKVLEAKRWIFKDSKKSNNARKYSQMVSFGKSSRNTNKSPLEKVLGDHFEEPAWDYLSRYLYEKAIVLVNNPQLLLPFHSVQEQRFRISSYGVEQPVDFLKYFNKYADFFTDHYPLPEEGGFSALKPHPSFGWSDIIVLGERSIQTERDSILIASINERAQQTSRVVVVNFGNPSNLALFDTTIAMVQLFEQNYITEQLAPQVLFGAVETIGQLPTAINAKFPKGHGLNLPVGRIKYSVPEEVGIDPKKLVGIDAIARTAIDNRMMPGCQVLVAKEGKVIYSKAFGYHTYRKIQPVRVTDLYDLASLTKIAATTLSAMKLYDQKQFNVNDRLRNHLTLNPNATIRNIPLKRLFTHQSGLQPNMPIATYLREDNFFGEDCTGYFCASAEGNYSIKVADQFFFDYKSLDTIWTKIQRLPLRRVMRYRYSDVNFYLLQRMIEEKTGMSLSDYTEQFFYRPLGLRRCLYNPLDEFTRLEITPTQLDNKWRKQLVHAHVHDEAAALNGGIGGHAGLFSSAEELVPIFQMMINGGTYGQNRFLSAQTIELFTSTQSGSYRGLGFNKAIRGGRTAWSPATSKKTYGHTGFTGTCVWVDPEEELIYIFLANRIHPSTLNKKLFRYRVRERIHKVVYQALDTYTLKLPNLHIGEKNEGFQN